MPSPTPAMPAAVKTIDVGHVYDENGAVTKTLDMVVEEFYVVIDISGHIPTKDEND